MEFEYVTDWYEPAHFLTTPRGEERYGEWCEARVAEWNGKGLAGRLYTLVESTDGYVCVEMAKRVRKSTRETWRNQYSKGRLSDG